MTAANWLVVALLLPAAGAVLLQVVPGRWRAVAQWWTILVTLATTVIVAALVVGLGSASATSGPLAIKDETFVGWIPDPISANFHIGLTGISAWLLVLNAGVFLLGALVVSRRDTDRMKFFCGLMLLTETATAGVILSLDLLLFYFFWEGMLIPLYFLLSNVGGDKRGPATLKFVIYTVAGSLAMLLGIIYLRAVAGSFDLPILMQRVLPDTGFINVFGWHVLNPAQLVFLCFALAFAIKIPLVPFHTWLPDLYEAAPSAALTFFAGVVSKLGAFGFIQFTLTLFPGPVHDFQWLLLALSLANIIYGALMALSETDIKRIVAYSSISHLGFIGLGIFALNQNGLDGAVIQIINHGIIIAALFLVVGLVESRAGTRDRHQIAGLERRMPYLYAVFLVITLAGLGMPGMNSFVGEFTIMLGAFQTFWPLAVIASLGVILAGWYMLRLHQGLMHEPLHQRLEHVRDLTIREGWIFVPLVALMVFLGVFPKPVGDLAQGSTPQYLSAQVQPSQPTTTYLAGER